MQPLNAIDALTPAFTRTHETLFKPFRWGRSWKLAASQYLGFCGSMFVPFPLLILMLPPSLSGMRTTLFAVSFVLMLTALALLYFLARMELVCFEMLATRAKFVAPMWRRYSGRVWPWLGFKILVGTAWSLIVAALFFAPLRHLVEAMIATIPAGGFPVGAKPDPEAVQAMFGPMMANMIHLEFILLGLVFPIKIPSTLLNDFVLPFFVLEDISLVAAVGRGFKVFVTDPLQVLLYLILKPILFVTGYIVQSIALQIAMIPVAILAVIVGVIAAVAGVSFRHIGPGSGLLIVAAVVVLVALFFFAIFYATFFLFGYLLALLEAYGIYFLAGRYPLLGNLLEPGPGAPFTPPPVFPSEDERGDDDGGPPMPMDPAVA